MATKIRTELSSRMACRFDEEIVTKHQWVGRGSDGFPSLEGNEEQIMGNELIIRRATHTFWHSRRLSSVSDSAGTDMALLCRKIDDNPIDDETRSAVRAFCVKLVESVNKYYAFGSCFVDDNT